MQDVADLHGVVGDEPDGLPETKHAVRMCLRDL